VATKRQMIEVNHSDISITRQCELLDLARSSLYYKPIEADAYELFLMKLIDQQYTATPFYGIRKMTAWLRQQGEVVNHKRVARLMKKMEIEAIYPKPKTTIGAMHQSQRYPYLLKGKVIDAPNQVWSTDITYIRMPQGSAYFEFYNHQRLHQALDYQTPAMVHFSN
jgi:putative transposase